MRESEAPVETPGLVSSKEKAARIIKTVGVTKNGTGEELWQNYFRHDLLKVLQILLLKLKVIILVKFTNMLKEPTSGINTYDDSRSWTYWIKFIQTIGTERLKDKTNKIKRRGPKPKR
nr:hypothetical protein [Mycoplasmopsis bovis]